MKELITILSLMVGSNLMSAQTCAALFSFEATPITISFQDLSTHAANDPIISWDWDFDDGSGSSQQNPTHTFPEPDRYDVNLTITTQSGCSSNIEIRIEICDFGINYNIGTCNANNQVPVTFTITDIYDNAEEIDVILDGQSVPGSPFAIDAGNPVNVTVSVPGNGLEHTINIQSTDIETCGRTITFVTDDCLSDCFLGSLNLQFSGGTTHNVTVGDNFFSPQTVAIDIGDIVHFTWQGSGHSTTSDATSGPDSWNSGVIGGGSTFDVVIDNPGTHPYYCQPHGGPNGIGMSGQILSNCPGGSTLPLTVSFNTTIANPAGYNILWDNVPVPGSPFSYSGVGMQTRTINIAGDGLQHNLVVRDVADPTCDIELAYTTPDCDQGGGTPVCSISGTVGNFGGCNNNNVTATLTVNVTNGGSGFNVSIDNGPNTFHAYTGNTTIVTITLPGNGANHSVKITDSVDPLCTSTINVVTPNCNIPCSIANLTATASSGSGGASGIVHTVNVQDFQFNPNVVNITVGDVVQWVWTGAIAHTSTSDAPSGPDSWNSGLLNTGATYTSPLLAEGTHPYYCVPHGAPGGVGMSGTVHVLPPCNANGQTNVVVAFNITSNGTQGFQVLVDGVVAGTFPYVGGSAQSATVSVEGDAMSHTILVRDVANQSCNASTTVITPNCNGGGNPECSMTMSANVNGGCSNNTVPVQLNIAAVNNSTSFTVKVDGTTIGTYAYANLPVTINVAGDGNSHNILATDVGDPTCSHSVTLTTPNCTLPCSITGLVANVADGSGGASGTEHIVNVEDFQFNPNIVNITVGDVVKWIWTGSIPHTSTSDQVGTPNSWNSGLLGNGSTYTSPVLDEGEYGYYCVPHGAPGGVGMSGTIHVLPSCNSFGQATVQVTFNATNGGSAGYSVIVDGNNAGNFSYAPGSAQSASVLVAGNGAFHNIIVQDIANSSCNATTSIVTPNCGGGGNPVCSIIMNPSTTGVCTNGLVPVALNVSGINHSASYLVTVDGQAAGSFNYNNSAASINIIGNGLAHTIVITDSVDPSCTATTSFVTPNCSLPCGITITDISFGENISHTVQVQDFQFFPGDLTVNLGDTIDFVWTGVIPHTATSEAPTGPNSFNSGLLGNGSTFRFIPTATGSIPYYCIPHGAPGGVGMSGVINVTSSCNENIANGNLSFQYSGTSAQGFIITQDNIAVPGSPFSFSPTGNLTIPLAVNGDGASHSFSVTDVGNTGCSAQQTVIVPSCNPSCQINITQATVSACTGNTVTLNIGFTSNQINAEYNIYKDGIKLNPSALSTDANGAGLYSTFIVGNGITANISIQFIGNGTCTASQSLAIPSCASPCLITDLVVGQHGNSHVVEVRDFNFFPASIDVLLGDTVRFVWTGAIPHTSTSDAITGENAWNSGLLGQGATYDVVISDIGTFPYYCQPHGGPGGIGMSGVINVVDTCAVDKWLTNLSFNVSAGSPLGYNVYVDGVKITDEPLHYDNPVGFNSEIIRLPGDGTVHLVTIQDMETGFCAYTQPVLTSLCGAGCSVVGLTANTGVNIIHTVEVRDFDYYPQHITVGAGESIRFVWVGDIPHTVTSDAVSGPEVFNSGLLGEGATYLLTINTPGVHPYFCIPHGGPGGIGMSGSITVIPACADNNQNVQLSFDVTNGSLEGYNLFVDGVPFGNNPRAYQDRLGHNELMLSYPADNAQHIITVQDLQNNICAASDFFTMGTCNVDCEISGLDYFLGNGRKHEVLVRDFDYAPATIRIELGDTVHFKWIGSIPHTVTSDVASGPDSFNSGLLGTGASYNVVLTEKGLHRYYCIPHGAPGGIGMSGSIEVVDPCEDGKVFVDFRFFSEGTGVSYDVLNHDNVVLNDVGYVQGGVQKFALELLAQGQSHLIKISDNGPDDCITTIALDSFDCADPCFLVRADFKYNIDFSSNEVVFSDKSRGSIITWLWEFGDGTTSTLNNPVHVFPESILYEVCLTITDINGCVETFCDKLRLGSDVCRASFTYQQNGLEFIFTNTSDVAEDTITATWSFGDGITSTSFASVEHVFHLGLYEVCLTVTANGCLNTYCEILDLTDACLAMSAQYETDIDAGNPKKYRFNDMSSGPVDSRLWGFGDGQISTDLNPTHEYQNNGEYTVCLLVMDAEGNCTDSDCRTLFVGTTGNEPVDIPMKKVTVIPNPVSLSFAQVTVSGFDSEDLGITSRIIVVDMNGTQVSEVVGELGQEQTISLPQISGVYFLQVVTVKNLYGAMIVVQ